VKYIPGLDTLRAFAVFFVLIEHKGVWFDTTVPNGKFIKDVIIPDGGFGVILFFVLSGFLITTILLQQRNENVSGRIPAVRNFYIRRSLRIFPIYFLLLLFLYCINYVGLKENIGYHLTYTTNILCYRTNQWNSFSHAWTLSVEEQFYLLWPCIIIFIREKYLKHVFACSVFIGIASTWYCMDVRGHMAPLLVFNCFDSFGIGGLLAWSLPDERRSKEFRRLMKWPVGIALCVYLYWKFCGFLHIAAHGFVFSKTIDSVLAAWLIMSVVNAGPSMFRRYFLENRLLTFIGKISYGIYLYHYVYNVLVYYQLNNYLAGITIHSPGINQFVRDAHFYYWLHVALTIAIAACSYYIIERPFLNLRKFVNYNSLPQPNI
jgi:peptidoglycan/LPS O-acetylase OafA/YrhL